ncbi:unnamed protein product, partial [Rotaria sordida]
MALEYLRKALDIELTRAQQDHALLTELYANIAYNYKWMNDNKMALKNYQIGLKHCLK